MYFAYWQNGNNGIDFDSVCFTSYVIETYCTNYGLPSEPSEMGWDLNCPWELEA